MGKARQLLIALALSGVVSPCSGAIPAVAEGCGDPFDRGGFGPFDYTNSEHQDQMYRVTSEHFTPSVEALQAGATSENLMHDLDFTLRAIPNHHRALYAMLRHKLNPAGKQSGYKTPECYFQRALQFKPTDGVVHMLFGIYLYGNGDMQESLEELQQAVKIMPSSAEAHYNLGLVSLAVKDHEAARKHAQEAYRLGYPLPGLRERLQELGVWEESSSHVETPQAQP
ncbi:MAG: tetratricopeptide repeat protein [Gammaproteobacteria bacterium]